MISQSGEGCNDISLRSSCFDSLIWFIQDKDKKKEITSLLGDMPDERFALLVNLGKKITDYAIEKDMGGDGKLWMLLLLLWIYKFLSYLF